MDSVEGRAERELVSAGISLSLFFPVTFLFVFPHPLNEIAGIPISQTSTFRGNPQTKEKGQNIYCFWGFFFSGGSGNAKLSYQARYFAKKKTVFPRQ